MPPTWRKSTYSTDDANCVEIAYWLKSTFSTDQANCLEVTFDGPIAAIRDSKSPNTPHLTLPPSAFQALLTFTTR